MADSEPENPGRRRLLRAAGVTAGVAVLGAGAGGVLSSDALATLLQDHFRRMDAEELAAALARIERRAKADHGVDIHCRDTAPIPGVRFGMALNLSRCSGSRRCVEACVRENNCGRGGTLENIRVLEMERGSHDMMRADHYYTGQVPRAGKWYLPVQCQQCDQPACVQACPVEATWKEPDGMVVIDYDWCIGCRYCAAACPYWARHFNWGKPHIPAAEINPETHYLGNRPRPRGVMEKCTFCIQRTRQGRLPACQEACPTGARIFGDLADPNSDIRLVLARRPVYRLKEDLGTEPNYWYYTDAPT